MKAKARVHAALERQPVDRVPIFLWFHPDTRRRLAAVLDVPMARVGELLRDDVHQAWVGNNHAMEGVTHDREGETHTDAWGIEWVREGPFNQIRRSPLQDADSAAIRRYRYPHDAIEGLLGNMATALAARDEFFVGCDVSPCLFEMVCRLRGMEGALLDLAAEPDLAEHLLDGAAAFAEDVSRRACARLPLDWLWTGDDVGGQLAMMMSPETWRRVIRPRLARIVAIGKAHGLWVAYHSCGAVRAIVPDLIEIGVDVLNPVQCQCPGMDPLALKREFGADLAFMGGLDTQDLVPTGTPDEVFRSARRLIDGMTADGGGYILAAAHAVPPETPAENVFAIYAAAGVSRAELFDRAAALRRQAQER